jgi:hypothetical protein
MNYYQKYIKYKEKYINLLNQKAGAQSEETQFRLFLNEKLETHIDDVCFEQMKRRLFTLWKRKQLTHPDILKFYKKTCLKQISERDLLVDKKRTQAQEARKKKIDHSNRLYKLKNEKERLERQQELIRKTEAETKDRLRTEQLEEFRRKESKRLAYEKKLSGGEGIIFAHGATVKDRFCVIPENLTIRPTVKCFEVSPRENYMKNELLIDSYEKDIQIIENFIIDPTYLDKLVLNKLNEEESTILEAIITQINTSTEKYIRTNFLRKYFLDIKEIDNLDSQIVPIITQLNELFQNDFNKILEDELITSMEIFHRSNPEIFKIITKLIQDFVSYSKSKSQKENFIKIFNHILKDNVLFGSPILNEYDMLKGEILLLNETDDFIKPLIKRQTREQISSFAYGSDLSLKYDNIYEPGSIIPDMKLIFDPTYPIIDGKGAYSFTGIITDDLELLDGRLISSFTDPGGRLEDDLNLQRRIKDRSMQFHNINIIPKENLYMGPPKKKNLSGVEGIDFFYLSTILKIIRDYKVLMDKRPTVERLKDPFPSTFILQSCRGAEDSLSTGILLEDCHEEEKRVVREMSMPQRVSSFSDTPNPFIISFLKSINPFFTSNKHLKLSIKNETKLEQELLSREPLKTQIEENKAKIELYISRKLTEIKQIIDENNFISNEDFCFLITIIKEELNKNILDKIISTAI